MLLSAMEQDWYGFGGAWGEPDLDRRFMSLPDHISVSGLTIERTDYTGPLGPSKYKGIWPTV